MGARSPMLIAVGMYLPFDTTSAIAVGGLIKWVLELRIASRSDEEKLAIEDRGSFIASGMIAGEAIMGIILAATFLGGIPSFTRLLTGEDQFGFYAAWGGWLSLAAFAAIAYALIRIPLPIPKIILKIEKYSPSVALIFRAPEYLNETYFAADSRHNCAFFVFQPQCHTVAVDELQPITDGLRSKPG